jgi:hypothetical protein
MAVGLPPSICTVVTREPLHRMAQWGAALRESYIQLILMLPM